jgi:Rrf2 family protein
LDLQLTHRGDYAIRAAIALARGTGSDRYVKLREVSEEMAIPLRYTQEILTLLMRAGLAEARAGKTGGYRLTKRPEDISLLDVVAAAEGPLRLERCTLSGGPCHWEETVCAVHAIWEQANGALVTSLRGQSLARVLEVDDRLRERSRAGTKVSRDA